MGRSGPASHRAAAAVEEHRPHPMPGTGGSQFRLGAVQRPLAGEDAAVLVAVGITDHHLEGGPGGQQTALRDWMAQESLGNPRPSLKVAHGFK